MKIFKMNYIITNTSNIIKHESLKKKINFSETLYFQKNEVLIRTLQMQVNVVSLEV